MQIIQLTILLGLLAVACSGCQNEAQIEKPVVSQIISASDSVANVLTDSRKLVTDSIWQAAIQSIPDVAAFIVPLFTGKLSSPDFTGNPFAHDPEYVAFISSGCERVGINFGGHYTAIIHSCGMGCVHLFLVDRIDGRIHTNDGLTEGYGGYQFRPTSTLLIADSNMTTGEIGSHDNRQIEILEWKGNSFQLLKQ